MAARIRRSFRNYVALRMDYFRNGKEQIANGNLQALKRASSLTIVIFAAMTAGGILTDRSTGFMSACALAFALDIVIFVTVFTREQQLRGNIVRIHGLCLFFLLSMCAFLTYISTAGVPETAGILFSPFLIILTIVFVLPPWQTVTLVTVASLAFALLSAAVKTWNNVRLDGVIAVLTWGLSLMTALEMLSIRLRDYHLRDELMRRSRTDSLTGLMNKTTAENATRNYLERFGAGEASALMVIDLDQFKQVNDILGHQAGDEVLETFGETLMNLFRSQDIVGRVGGDEFIVLMKQVDNRELIARRAEAICNAARDTRTEGFDHALTCSVGIALCPTHGIDYDRLFHRADEALYLLKRSGKNNYLIAE